MAVIRSKKLELPVIQGGMGIGVSLGNLAGHVAREGGMGVISIANPGYAERDFWDDPEAANFRAIEKEIRKAREIAGGCGMIAVNAMVATRSYRESVEKAISAGADAVISGAGLPINLPGFAGAEKTALAPVVSSARAAAALLKLWDKRFGRQPDFLVIEGSRAGGHLGFSQQELKEGRAKPLEQLLPEILAEVAPFAEKAGREIPVFVAGGVRDGHDLARFMRLGAAGAQMATRFIATEECDASPAYKEIMVKADQSQAVIIESPVGMPGRALASPLIREICRGRRIPPRRCTRCLTPCDPQTTPYCITAALVEAVRGNWQKGLFFCGADVDRADRIRPVAELLASIMEEWREEQ